MKGMVLEKFVMGLCNTSVQAAVIFCVLVLARAFFSAFRIQKKYACFLWMILFVRLLMPVVPESPVGLWTKGSELSFLTGRSGSFDGVAAGENMSAPEEQIGTRGAEAPRELYGTEGAEAPWELYGTEGAEASEELPGTEKEDASGKIRLALCLIWGAGFLGFLLYGGVSCLLLKKKLRCSIRSEDNCYLADGIPTAFVLGLFPPRVYLPSELGKDEMAYVVLHEKTHIRRKDYLVKMTAYLITCVYWFHPFVWAALILLGRDMELSCDEAVIRKLGEGGRRAYADTLLRLSGGRSDFAGIPLAFGEGNTESRIRHIMKYRKPTIAVSAMAVTAAVLVLSGLALGLLTERTTEKPTKKPIERPTAGYDGSMAESALPSGNNAQFDGQEGMTNGEQRDLSLVNSRFPEPVKLPSGHTVTVTGDVYDISVDIDGKAYGMADLCGMVNALTDITEFGNYIVVKGHISPDHSYYGFYNTESQQWEQEFTGALLIWDENWEALENPIESVIYTETGDNQVILRDWKTERIAVFDLEDEYVYDLKRAGNDATMTIVNYEGESRELSFEIGEEIP